MVHPFTLPREYEKESFFVKGTRTTSCDPEVLASDKVLAVLNAQLFDQQARMLAERDQTRREVEIAVSLGENI